MLGIQEEVRLIFSISKSYYLKLLPISFGEFVSFAFFVFHGVCYEARRSCYDDANEDNQFMVHERLLTASTYPVTYCHLDRQTVMSSYKLILISEVVIIQAMP